MSLIERLYSLPKYIVRKEVYHSFPSSEDGNIGAMVIGITDPSGCIKLIGNKESANALKKKFVGDGNWQEIDLHIPYVIYRVSDDGINLTDIKLGSNGHSLYISEQQDNSPYPKQMLSIQKIILDNIGYMSIPTRENIWLPYTYRTTFNAEINRLLRLTKS